MSINSSDSDVLYVEQSSNDSSLPNRKRRLSSTPQRCQATTPEKWYQYHPLHRLNHISWQSTLIRIKQQCQMDLDDSSQKFQHAWTICNLNLPPNPFNILATMAGVNPTEVGLDENYSPQSPEPSEPSPISTPLMNVKRYNSWESPHTTTDDNTFYLQDKPRRIHWTSPLDETFNSQG